MLKQRQLQHPRGPPQHPPIPYCPEEAMVRQVECTSVEKMTSYNMEGRDAG